ncbi:MAG: septum formation inhibitor Maf [Deltaproteobacteria bacterium]|nr:septum formation inhibitor Maf [Deltaproteobacteria bacterium]
MSRLILASQSPRRRELLAALGISFDVIPSRADETLREGLPVADAIEEVAVRKAREVAEGVGGPCWVLGADTAVVLDDEVLGKPRDRHDAEAMLRRLSGRAHRVVTGLALVGGARIRRVSAVTEVRFRPLTEEQIAWYASGEEPYDKAGAYAIQGRGAFLVEAIEGSYTNVVGLPVREVVRLLEAERLSPWPPGAEGEGGRD